MPHYPQLTPFPPHLLSSPPSAPPPPLPPPLPRFSTHVRCGNMFEVIGRSIYLAVSNACPTDINGNQRSSRSDYPQVTGFRVFSNVLEFHGYPCDTWTSIISGTSGVKWPQIGCLGKGWWGSPSADYPCICLESHEFVVVEWKVKAECGIFACACEGPHMGHNAKVILPCTVLPPPRASPCTPAWMGAAPSPRPACQWQSRCVQQLPVRWGVGKAWKEQGTHQLGLHERWGPEGVEHGCDCSSCLFSAEGRSGKPGDRLRQAVAHTSRGGQPSFLLGCRGRPGGGPALGDVWRQGTLAALAARVLLVDGGNREHTSLGNEGKQGARRAGWALFISYWDLVLLHLTPYLHVFSSLPLPLHSCLTAHPTPQQEGYELLETHDGTGAIIIVDFIINKVSQKPVPYA